MKYPLKDVGNEPKDEGYELPGMYSNSFMGKPAIKEKPAQ